MKPLRDSIRPVTSMWRTGVRWLSLRWHSFFRDTSNPLSPHLNERVIRIAQIERPVRYERRR
jgi:hypothetical protein